MPDVLLIVLIKPVGLVIIPTMHYNTNLKLQIKVSNNIYKCFISLLSLHYQYVTNI